MTEVSRHFRTGAQVSYVTWPTFKFWNPLHISGISKAADLKFSVWIELKTRKPKNAKVGQ